MMDTYLNYSKGQKENKNWLVEETAFNSRYTGKCEAIFSQGNGYLGLRNALEEKYVHETRNMFAAGTFNKASADEVTELPNLPDITNTEIEINGQRFSMDTGIVSDYSRTLNLYTGETVRSLIWESPDGDKVKLSFHRFVSFDNLHIIGNYIELTPLSGKASFKLISGIDGQVTNSGAQHFTEISKRAYDGVFLEYTARTTESGVLACIHTAHTITAIGAPKLTDGNISGSGSELPDGNISGGGSGLPDGRAFKLLNSRILDDRRRIYCCMEFEAEAGASVRIEKVSSVHTSRDKAYSGQTISPEKLSSDGLSLIKEAAEKGFGNLFSDSRRVWEALWKSQDIKIESSNDFDQLAVRFALYHLNTMTNKNDSRIGIGAKGLSGEGYKGHSFWDTETFIFPYFQLAEPETARTLLKYRYKGLYGARQKALTQGYEGAMYPWESAWITDGEVTPYIVGVNVHNGEPMYCLTGIIEIHITADIIYALWQYYISSGDGDFMDKYGYEMIIETARFWNSRLEWSKENNRYEIRDVIGPDEYKEHVDNNAYTNYMAAYNMKLAAAVIDKLEHKKPEIYRRLSALADLSRLKADLEDKLSKLYLPAPDNKTGIIPQFDGYFDLKEIDLAPYKAASTVGTLFNDYSMEDIQHCQAGKQADVVELLYQLEDIADAETKRSNYMYYEQRTLHDSSLSKAIHSITAGDLGLLPQAYDMFVKAASTDLGQTMTSSDAGIHSANMGGIWQDVVMGFGGIRIIGGKLHIRPHLPAHWERLTYPIYWKGSRMTVSIQPHSITIDNSGTAADALIFNKSFLIEPGLQTFNY